MFLADVGYYVVLVRTKTWQCFNNDKVRSNASLIRNMPLYSRLVTPVESISVDNIYASFNKITLKYDMLSRSRVKHGFVQGSRQSRNGSGRHDDNLGAKLLPRTPDRGSPTISTSGGPGTTFCDDVFGDLVVLPESGWPSRASDLHALCSYGPVC